jgi:hypothetical protein
MSECVTTCPSCGQIIRLETVDSEGSSEEEIELVAEFLKQSNIELA